MANFEIVYMNGKLDTLGNHGENKTMGGMLSIVVLLFGNGCIMGGNGVTFPFAPCASPSPTDFYNVACKLPLRYDLLFMMDFLYRYGNKFKFHSHILKLNSMHSMPLSYRPKPL